MSGVEQATRAKRAVLKRHAEREVPGEAAEILLAGKVAHLGFVQDGQPFVIPLTYQYDNATPDRLYLHGSHASRALRHLSSGAPVCVTVTLLDGLVYSRTAQDHSMNYRSVVLFGTARPVTDNNEKARIFTEMIGRYHPGRTAGREYESATPAQLKATQVVEVIIEDMSAKARRGGPRGQLDEDPAAPGTCGVLSMDAGE